jgi:hypothetical protein
VRPGNLPRAFKRGSMPDVVDHVVELAETLRVHDADRVAVHSLDYVLGYLLGYVLGHVRQRRRARSAQTVRRDRASLSS